MKKLLIGAGAVAAFAAMGPAMAADLPARPVYKAPVVAPVVFSWSGCYIGGNLGGKWLSRTSGSVSIPAATGPGGATPASFFAFADDSSSNSGTFIGGGQVGCNYQVGSFVIGIEGDIDAQKWDRTLAAGVVGVAPAIFAAGSAIGFSSRWEASLRGRIGYAWDRVLLYATGGAAWTDLNATAAVAVIGVPAAFATFVSQRDTVSGATVGGGLEYAITNNLSLGIEGRYTWYDTRNFAIPVVTASVGACPAACTVAPASAAFKFNTAEVMGKLNWRFDWFGGPVRAAY